MSEFSLPKPKLSSIAKHCSIFDPNRIIFWLGGVNYANFSEVTEQVGNFLQENNGRNINLFITSPGGQTGIAMSFYDMIKSVIGLNLWMSG